MRIIFKPPKIGHLHYHITYLLQLRNILTKQNLFIFTNFTPLREIFILWIFVFLSEINGAIIGTKTFSGFIYSIKSYSKVYQSEMEYWKICKDWLNMLKFLTNIFSFSSCVPCCQSNAMGIFARDEYHNSTLLRYG